MARVYIAQNNDWSKVFIYWSYLKSDTAFALQTILKTLLSFNLSFTQKSLRQLGQGGGHGPRNFDQTMIGIFERLSSKIMPWKQRNSEKKLNLKIGSKNTCGFSPSFQAFLNNIFKVKLFTTDLMSISQLSSGWTLDKVPQPSFVTLNSVLEFVQFRKRRGHVHGGIGHHEGHGRGHLTQIFLDFRKGKTLTPR